MTQCALPEPRRASDSSPHMDERWKDEGEGGETGSEDDDEDGEEGEVSMGVGSLE